MLYWIIPLSFWGPLGTLSNNDVLVLDCFHSVKWLVSFNRHCHCVTGDFVHRWQSQHWTGEAGGHPFCSLLPYSVFLQTTSPAGCGEWVRTHTVTSIIIFYHIQNEYIADQIQRLYFLKFLEHIYIDTKVVLCRTFTSMMLQWPFMPSFI